MREIQQKMKINSEWIGSQAVVINLLKPTVYVTHRQVYHSRILHSAALVVYFVFTSEQTATFNPYNTI
jgi:hypothetical protein